jgi:hypothetical protein
MENYRFNFSKRKNTLSQSKGSLNVHIKTRGFRTRSKISKLNY